MTLVAVAPDKYACGFNRPGDEVPLAYEVMELTDALLRTYETDAHLVTYVVEGAVRQPRINKAGAPYFPTPAYVGVFFCDLDNPKHKSWSGDFLGDVRRDYEELPVFESTGLYLTRGGRRVVQPLVEPIPALQAEPYLRRWLLQLEDLGLPVDWQCRDWTRHFRLPDVRRPGVAFEAKLILLDRMRPIELEPIQDAGDTEDQVEAQAHDHPTRALPFVDWSSDVPELWRPRVEQIAMAVRDVTTEWHSLFMALAGALMTKGGAAPERVPVLCRAISLATGCDARTADRELAARTTVQRRVTGQRATGYGELARKWPTVADALDAATARRVEARLRELAASAPPPTSLAEVAAALEDALSRAPDGLTIVSAECGLGKTQAAIVSAATRAAKRHASPDARGSRAPLGSKTSISVDKNALAQQVANDLRVLGTPVRRIYGPLSVARPDGKPECRYHDMAKPLVEGGQAMHWELCRGRDIDPCSYFDECDAHDGVEGPPDARVTVGPHALLSELSACAGSTGLLVIDEPPPLLENQAFTTADFDTTRDMLRAFDGRYTGSLGPALDATRAWLASVGEVGVSTELEHIVRRCTQHVLPAELEQARRSSGCNGDAVDCGRAAPFPDGRPTKAPPLQSGYVTIARASAGRAVEIGIASRVLKALHHALTSETPVSVGLEKLRGERVLIFTSAREDFAAALRRAGPVVVTDASAEIHVPIYAKVVGYEPRHLRFAAGDGAPIERTLIRTRTATRRSWLRRRQVVVRPALLSAVRAVFGWAAEDASCKTLGLITMRPIELALRAALEVNSPLLAEWKASGLAPETLPGVAEKLGPIVRGWAGQIVFAHYGAVRGLNTMAGVDALVTLGDPWPNLDTVRNDAVFLDLGEDWQVRLEALCRAELEQAHGRLRTVHRTRPGRALHIGNVLPSGSGWQSGDIQIRCLPAGRPKTIASMGVARLEDLVRDLGSMRAAARALDCDDKTIRRYLLGDRAIPPPIAARLLNAPTQVGHAP